MAYIIHVTGNSGTGKTSLLSNLTEKIKSRDYNVETIREPGPLRDFAKAYRLRGDKSAWVETAIFATDRQMIYEKVIPRLGEERLVLLSERGFLDSIIYQGLLGDVDLEVIKKLNLGIPFPDLAICLTVDGIEGNRRAVQRFRETREVVSSNESPEKINILAGYYRSLPDHFPDRNIKIIDTTNIDNDETCRLCFEEVRKVLR